MKNRSNKRIFLIIVLFIGIVIIAFIFAYIRKPLIMDDVIENKPKFTGTVIEIYDESILLNIDEDDPIIKSSDKILVSLDVKMSDVSVSKDDFNIGDRVSVYYDGNIAESYPAQVNEVYAILHEDVTDKNPENMEELQNGNASEKPSENGNYGIPTQYETLNNMEGITMEI